jgi:DnaK suppressor protein
MPTALNAPTPAAPVDVDAFRTQLVDVRADAVRQRELALIESATSLPDPVAVRRAASLLRSIEEIDAALQRIAEGTYGSCVRCARTIPAERLEFRPHAARCVACEEVVR